MIRLLFVSWSRGCRLSATVHTSLSIRDPEVRVQSSGGVAAACDLDAIATWVRRWVNGHAGRRTVILVSLSDRSSGDERKEREEGCAEQHPSQLSGTDESQLPRGSRGVSSIYMNDPVP